MAAGIAIANRTCYNLFMHKTASREEWLAARIELLKAEKEHTHRGDEIAKQRQELPWVYPG